MGGKQAKYVKSNKVCLHYYQINKYDFFFYINKQGYSRISNQKNSRHQSL